MVENKEPQPRVDRETPTLFILDSIDVATPYQFERLHGERDYMLFLWALKDIVGARNTRIVVAACNEHSLTAVLQRHQDVDGIVEAHLSLGRCKHFKAWAFRSERGFRRFVATKKPRVIAIGGTPNAETGIRRMSELFGTAPTGEIVVVYRSSATGKTPRELVEMVKDRMTPKIARP